MQQLADIADIADIDPAAFPELNDDQIRGSPATAPSARSPPARSSFGRGDDSYDFVVMVKGAIDIRTGSDDEVTIATHGPRRFSGELSMLQRAAGLLVRVGRRVQQGDRDRPGGALRGVRRRAGRRRRDPARAFVLRRQYLEEGEGQRSLQLIGSRFSPRTLALRGFLIHRRRSPPSGSTSEDHDEAEAEALLASLGARPEDTPVVVTSTKVLWNPTSGELAEHLG